MTKKILHFGQSETSFSPSKIWTFNIVLFWKWQFYIQDLCDDTQERQATRDNSNNIIKILILMIIQEKFEKQYKSCRLDIDHIF